MTDELVIAMPMRDKPTRETERALAQNTPAGITVLTLAGLPVDEARNLLVKAALEQGREYVLWIDDDAYWPPGAVEHMIATMQQHTDLAALAAMFCARKAHWPCAAYRDPGPVIAISDQVTKINGAGMHFTMTRASALREPIGPEPFRIDAGSRLPEDLSFFLRLHDAGMNAGLATSLQVAHVERESGMVFLPNQPPLKITGPSEFRHMTAQEIAWAEACKRSHTKRDYGHGVNGAYAENRCFLERSGSNTPR